MMASPVYPFLPYDILGDIIDIFAEISSLDDLIKLSTLSIFCHSRCRKHIFGTIKVGNKLDKVLLEQNVDDDYYEGDEEDWEDEEQVPDVVDTTPISRFISLISDHPTVASLVQRLHLAYPNQRDQRALPKTLEKLTNLSMIEIDLGGLEWTSLLSESLLTLSHVPSFQRLHIADTCFLPVSILGSLTHLRHLQLLRIMLSDDTVCGATTPPPKLKIFTISDVDVGPFTKRRDDGRHLVDLSELTHLHFDVGVTSSAKTVSQFINDQPTRVESVEKLSFVIVPDPSDSGQGDNSTLKECMDGWILPNRRKLTNLEVMSNINVETAHDPYSGLSSTLNKLEPDNVLSSLKVVVSINTIYGLHVYGIWRFGNEWNALPDVLVKPGWKSLKMVWIVVLMNGTALGELSRLDNIFKPLSSRSFETKIDVMM